MNNRTTLKTRFNKFIKTDRYGYLTKYILFITISVLFSALFTLIGPWWLIIIAPFLLGFFFKLDMIQSFFIGSASIIIFWGLIFMMSTPSGTVIYERVAYLLPINGSKVGLILITLMLGGLLGGLAAMNGTFWRNSMKIS